MKVIERFVLVPSIMEQSNDSFVGVCLAPKRTGVDERKLLEGRKQPDGKKSRSIANKTRSIVSEPYLAEFCVSGILMDPAGVVVMRCFTTTATIDEEAHDHFSLPPLSNWRSRLVFRGRVQIQPRAARGKASRPCFTCLALPHDPRNCLPHDGSARGSHA